MTHDVELAQHARRIVRISDGRIIDDAAVASPRDAATTLATLPAPTTGSAEAESPATKPPATEPPAPRPPEPGA